MARGRAHAHLRSGSSDNRSQEHRPFGHEKAHLLARDIQHGHWLNTPPAVSILKNSFLDFQGIPGALIPCLGLIMRSVEYHACSPFELREQAMAAAPPRVSWSRRGAMDILAGEHRALFVPRL